MRVYRYPTRVLTGDYIRSAVGLVVGAGVLSTTPASPAILVVFGGVVVLFGLFGMRTVQRHMMKVAVSDEEICGASFGTKIMSWGELEFLKLRYYGTKRQGRGGGGFMQLTLKGRGATLSFESSLQGFRYITWRAAKAIRENGLSVDPGTAGNLLAIGLDADDDAKPPPED